MIDNSVVLPNPCQLLGAKDLAYFDTPSNRRVPASNARHNRVNARKPQAQKWHSERGMVDTALHRWTRACEAIFCVSCTPWFSPRPVSDATHSCIGQRALHAACTRYDQPLDWTARPARSQSDLRVPCTRLLSNRSAATARARHVRRTTCTARSLQTACLARGLRSDRSAATARAQPVRTVGEAPYRKVIDRSAATARAQPVHCVRNKNLTLGAQS